MSETPTRILIVEDDLDVADMLYAYFNVQGYDVQIANWGEDAVDICHANLPRLVILDIRLPDIDGFEVARRLRHNRRTANVPIIFLTEKRGRSDRLQGLELGADDYITKPFDVQELGCEYAIPSRAHSRARRLTRSQTFQKAPLWNNVFRKPLVNPAGAPYCCA